MKPAQPEAGGGPRIARVDQTKLREGAYQAIKDAFTRGEFAPGDTLSLRMLAAQLGISMTPVREAVRRLVAEGALLDTPSRTLVVPPFDIARMRDLKLARLALESLVLDLTLDNMAPDTPDELDTILDRRTSSAEAKPDLQQNHDFHFRLYRDSGSDVLLPLVEALWLQYGAYLNLIIHHRDAPRIAEHLHHREIIAALRAGDRAAAQAALRADIERSFRVLAAEAGERTASHD